VQQTFWHKVPMVRILLAFASGIGVSMFYTFNFTLVVVYFLISLTLFIALPKVFQAYQQRWFSGIAVLLTFFFAGILVHLIQNPIFYPSHFSHAIGTQKYVVMVDEEPVQKSHSYKMRTKVMQFINTSAKQVPATGNILVYINKNNLTKLPSYGDVLVLDATDVREVPPPKNPFEFDYKRYLAFNHIYHQTYLKQEQLVFADVNNGSIIYKQIYSIQHYFKAVLNMYIQTPTEIGVAQALLYGFDDDIDEQTMSAYANTGTLHVLAVSGMHVGIIFFILSKVLFFMNKNKKLLLSKRLIIIACLWIYSALCGLSPSILRATVMFTFIISADILDRRSNIYNTLAASCFTLLCVDANMLANVGFQLSYMAVIGIVFIQPLIYKWYVPPNWLIDQIWKITSVSIAAQLATSPIGILYFHQFPNCFLFSNLLIIPLTTVILYACIGLLLVSKITAIAQVVGTATKYVIMFTNWLVMQVEDVPYAYVNGLQISIFQSILMYLLFLCLIFYFMYQYSWLFKASLMALLYFICINAYQNITQHQQKAAWVYSINNSNAIQLVNGTHAVLLLDSNVRYDKQKFKFHLQQHVWQIGVETIDTLTPTANWQQIKMANTTILLAGKQKYAPHYTNPDYLIIRHPLPVTLLVQVNPKQVIISGSLKPFYSKEIETFCQQKNIPVHHVTNSGAFNLSL
jgi:competence protein ComEC